MAKLPKSIIKKYGISKKAWSVFRGGGHKMARHRGKVHAKKHGMFGGSVFGSSSGSLIQIDAMAYGAARQYLANLISPVTSMIPLGTFADEIGMGLVDWMVAKNVKGFVGEIARKGLVIENSRVGEQLVGSLGMSAGSSALAGYNTGFSY